VELALRIVHLLAATIWVGGTVALVFVAVPPAQRLAGELRARQLRELGRRWRPLGWSALGVAVVTGIAMAAHERAFDRTPHDFDWVLAAKGLLVGALVAGAYLHDYVLGPALARQIRDGMPQTRRGLLVAIGRTNLVLTLAIPILGVVLSELLDR
jgi:uncharacterized membrane protein